MNWFVGVNSLLWSFFNTRVHVIGTNKSKAMTLLPPAAIAQLSARGSTSQEFYEFGTTGFSLPGCPKPELQIASCDQSVCSVDDIVCVVLN